MDETKEQVIENIQKIILRRLYNDNVIGDKHTAVEHLKKGIPPEYQHLCDKAIKRLFNESYLIKKITGYGLHVSLNQYKIQEIRKITRS